MESNRQQRTNNLCELLDQLYDSWSTEESGTSGAKHPNSCKSTIRHRKVTQIYSVPELRSREDAVQWTDTITTVPKPEQ